MTTINSIAEDTKDILDILKKAVLPSLNQLENQVTELGTRQDRLETKVDKIAEFVTNAQKTTGDRLRLIEQKSGVYHD